MPRFRQFVPLLLTCCCTATAAQPITTNEPVALRRFVGTSPCDAEIAAQLGLDADARDEIIEWTLSLSLGNPDSTPDTYQLRCDFGPTEPGIPGLGNQRRTRIQSGTVTIAKRGPAGTGLDIYGLHGAVSLVRISPDVLHVLNPDGSLRRGNSGFSFTLNQDRASEANSRQAPPSLSYDILPLATGPGVFAVFEGRTPYAEIAHELQITPVPGAFKAKWRVTLFKDPASGAPTTYRVEGTLHAQRPRSGNWSIVSGTPAHPSTVMYTLASDADGPPLHLLRGSDDVLFFLDRHTHPLAGNANFSYTLNRRDHVVVASTTSGP